MIYFVALPVTFLLWHSVYILSERYNKEIGPWDHDVKMPKWFISYALFVLGYVVITPSLMLGNILAYFGLNDMAQSVSAVTLGFLIFCIFIAKIPAKKKNSSEAP